jgi:signal transduction histidine kinase/DNA-binding response OmpR family regulator/CHASE3 domain sensor protein
VVSKSASGPSSSRPVSRSRSRALWPTSTAVGLVVALLAVISITLFSFRSLQARNESAQRVTHTLRVLELVEAVLSTVKDAETGQRGFIVTGEEGYAEPFVQADARLPGQLNELGAHLDEPAQRELLSQIRALADEKMTELRQTVELRRRGQAEQALAIIRSDRGKNAMVNLRRALSDLQDNERRALDVRQAEWREAVEFSSWVSWGSSGLLLFCIAAAAVVMSRDFRARERQSWVQSSRVLFTERIQGEQRLDQLGESILEFLAPQLGARVASIYIAEGNAFRRFAGYAIPAEQRNQAALVVRRGDGLLGQVAKDGKLLRVRDVPDEFLTVESSLGHSKVRELVLAPALYEGAVQAVIELGFFHVIDDADLEVLATVSESVGIAVRSSKDRTRLEELLEETQRQAEELQAQQEELRVSNEELEEQGRILKESQTRLENSQAELEQTNAQLEEQAQALEIQRDDLARAQEILEQRAADLQRANQYKSEFLANMSHELRTPLNSSLILAKLLADNKDGNLTGEQVKFAQTISSAGNDLLALINDILDLSKIEAGKVELQIEDVPVAPAVDGLMRTLQPLATQKGLTFTSSLESAPAKIRTDAQRLSQILKNLLANAIKFTDRGSITLSVRSVDGTVSFEVRDTGIGIGPDQHEAIFEAFRQADGSTHRKYGGTGLGLSIARDLARRLGGDILLHSTPGEGSTFVLNLPQQYDGQASKDAAAPARAVAPVAPVAPRLAPRAASSAPKPAAVPAPHIEDDREKLTDDARIILVIEDDLSFAGVLRDLVRELGFSCVVAHNARDGLEAALAYHVSAILLDVHLPDHSGLGVLDQLKRNPATRHIPVHVASVEDFSREALELGAVGYVLKPVQREELVKAIRTLEQKFTQGLRRVLVVEDDERQRSSVRELLSNGDVEIVCVATAGGALKSLASATFDCMVMDLNLPDLSGYELLEQMATKEDISFPPVIVYTGRSLSSDEEQRLRRFSKSIIIKDARSPERLLDEVTLFLHQMETKLPLDRQRMLKEVRNREAALEGRCILVVEDDVRNVFALTSLLEPKGVSVQIARNGKEALALLEKSHAKAAPHIDLVLMDLMMPEMDGLTCMREIRKRAEWKKLPIIALTAKAMKDDQEQSVAAGANDYIAKPLDVEKLLSLVRVWMPK